MCGIWGKISDCIDEQQSIVQASRVQRRGPERTNIKLTSQFMLVFHRLAINGLSESNDQPYCYEEPQINRKFYILCNGEIYNFKDLDSSMDCDTRVIYNSWKTLGYDFTSLNLALKGEYALVILETTYDTATPIRIFMSVDPCSVRPLFYSINRKQQILTFSSLLAGIHEEFSPVRLDGGWCMEYCFETQQTKQEQYTSLLPPCITKEECKDLYLVSRKIVETFEACIERRLHSDRPIGCFLSGGLDSSLVAALVAKKCVEKGLPRLHTFSIGAEDSEDVRNAQIVATHIGSIHTHVPFDPKEGLQVLDEVIQATETYDITTIRASIGQFLISKWISKNTDIKVVFSGDGADEAEMGYLYFFKAPTNEEAQQESYKLIKNIHYYDGLRVDRCVSWHGLEARVPYLDWEFVQLMLEIPSYLKRPKLATAQQEHKIEKWLIRHAIQNKYPHLLPSCVLWRVKETFSDSLTTKTSSLYSLLHQVTGGNEASYYRTKFMNMFSSRTYLIPGYWMPKWSNTTDPSARTLEVYEKVQ